MYTYIYIGVYIYIDINVNWSALYFAAYASNAMNLCELEEYHLSFRVSAATQRVTHTQFGLMKVMMMLVMTIVNDSI